MALIFPRGISYQLILRPVLLVEAWGQKNNKKVMTKKKKKWWPKCPIEVKLGTSGILRVLEADNSKIKDNNNNHPQDFMILLKSEAVYRTGLHYYMF